MKRSLADEFMIVLSKDFAEIAQYVDYSRDFFIKGLAAAIADEMERTVPVGKQTSIAPVRNRVKGSKIGDLKRSVHIAPSKKQDVYEGSWLAVASDFTAIWVDQGTKAHSIETKSRPRIVRGKPRKAEKNGPRAMIFPVGGKPCFGVRVLNRGMSAKNFASAAKEKAEAFMQELIAQFDAQGGMNNG